MIFFYFSGGISSLSDPEVAINAFIKILLYVFGIEIIALLILVVACLL